MSDGSNIYTIPESRREKWRVLKEANDHRMLDWESYNHSPSLKEKLFVRSEYHIHTTLRILVLEEVTVNSYTIKGRVFHKQQSRYHQ